MTKKQIEKIKADLTHCIRHQYEEYCSERFHGYLLGYKCCLQTMFPKKSARINDWYWSDMYYREPEEVVSELIHILEEDSK